MNKYMSNILFYTDPYSALDNFSAYQVEIW
jgi:hypothetical protein